MCSSDLPQRAHVRQSIEQVVLVLVDGHPRVEDDDRMAFGDAPHKRAQGVARALTVTERGARVELRGDVVRRQIERYWRR